MKANLIVAAVFVWAVCHVTDAADVNATVLPSNISNTDCNATKLCWSNTTDCNGSNSSCIFTSFQVTNQNVFFELSGPSSGYLGLGIASNNTAANDVVFVCANNHTNAPNNIFFYNTAIQNNTTLNLTSSVSTIYGVQGLLSNTLIQCTFNISTNLIVNSTTNSTTNSTNNVTLLNISRYFSVISGNTTGAILESATNLFNFTATLTPMPKPAISTDGCNKTKLCLINANCTLGNSSCFYTSIQQANDLYTIELSGPTTGYVALALTQNKTYMFACAKNNLNNSFFSQSATYENATVTPANITMNNVVGLSSTTLNLTQCTFNINTTLSPSISRAINTSFIVGIYSGSVSGTQLLTPTQQFASGLLNLANATGAFPNGSNSLISFWTNVLAVLFSVMSVYFITSPSP